MNKSYPVFSPVSSGFFDVDIEIDALPEKKVSATPEGLQLLSPIGRPARTAQDLMENSDVVGKFVNVKQGCPFDHDGRGNHKDASMFYLVSEDRSRLTFGCYATNHGHEEKDQKTDRNGRAYYCWTVTRDMDRKHQCFKLGSHVEMARRTLALIGDVALDEGDLIREFEGRSGGRRGAAHPDFGTWRACHKDKVMEVIRQFDGAYVYKGTDKKGNDMFSRVVLTNQTVEAVYREVVSILRAAFKGDVDVHGNLATEFSRPRTNPLVAHLAGVHVVSDKGATPVSEEHFRECFIRTESRLPFNWMGAHTPKLFIDALRRFWRGCPDVEERILFTQEWFGLVLAGEACSTKKHYYMMGSSEGNNGKSFVADILKALLPRTAVSAVGLEDLDDPFSLCDLIGSFLNVQVEVPSKKLINGTLLKSLTGNDMVRADRKHKSSVKFVSRAAFLLGGNEEFVSSDRSDALYGRFVPITFPHEIPANERIPGYAEHVIKTEGSHILGWAIDGLVRWHQQGKKYTHVPSSETARTEWKCAVDPLARWLEEEVEYDPKSTLSPAESYSLFSVWCKQNGVHPVSSRKYGDALARRNWTGTGAHKARLHLIRLRDEVVRPPLPPEVQALFGKDPAGTIDELLDN